MRFCIVGAGGLGISLAAALATVKEDVTLIARGENLSVIRKKGLTVTPYQKGPFTVPVTVKDRTGYRKDLADGKKPDVVFICVKKEDVEEILPFLKETVTEESVVIPLTGGLFTGEALQKEMPDTLVLDGCATLFVRRTSPGKASFDADFCRICFGAEDGNVLSDITAGKIFETAAILRKAKIDVTLSENIRQEMLQTFSLYSPLYACCIKENCQIQTLQKAGEERLLLEDLIREIERLAEAMGEPLIFDAVKTNLDLIDIVNPEISPASSLVLKKDRETEASDWVGVPLSLGKEYGVPMPYYERVWESLPF